MDPGNSEPASVTERLSGIETVLCDLDGVVWLEHHPIAGSVEAVAALRASGRQVLFVTNNSAARQGQHEDRLADIGIDASGSVISSAMAAATLVEPGERVLITGGDGIVEAVEHRGAVAVANVGQATDEPFDVVVVGLDRHLDYARLRLATSAVLAGARLIGTNTDPTYPTPDGLQPGGGAILAAVATAAGVEPTIGGKPHPPMADLVLRFLGIDRSEAARSLVMVGDRSDTDGLLAARLGCRFALVRTGVTRPEDSIDIGAPGPGRDERPTVHLDLADLAALLPRLDGRHPFS